MVRKNSLRRILAKRNIVTLLSYNERICKLSPVNVADSKRIQAGQHFDERQHHESLRREFPSMRSIEVLGKPVTGSLVLPSDPPDFEEAALRACQLVLAGDPRIGKVPGTRRPATPRTKATPNSAAKRPSRK